MSTAAVLQIGSSSSDATEQLGLKIGSKLKGGEVIELISDLGGGKTTFVRGLTRGFGSNDIVASPTFMIKKVYKAGDKEIHHLDFYRLQEAGLMQHELQDSLRQPNIVTAIEWGDIIRHFLPEDRLTVRISSTGEQTREIIFSFPRSLAYLTEGLST